MQVFHVLRHICNSRNPFASFYEKTKQNIIEEVMKSVPWASFFTFYEKISIHLAYMELA